MKLKSSSKTSAPKEPAGADCEICRNIPSYQYIDLVAGESFPPVADRLEPRGDARLPGLRRCPLCHTFYLVDDESDTHHFISAERSLVRIDGTRALRELALCSGSIARKWLDDLRRRMGKS